MIPGNWVYSTANKQCCRVLDSQSLWGSSICRIWLPLQNRIIQVPANDLKPLSESGLSSNPNYLKYLAAATRVAEAMANDVLVAPIESSVIPLPHQIHVLSRALSGERIRYLLADEVGLGKTIEAGLILRELKLRGLVKRILIAAPKGLVTQWVSEMQTHFNEDFRLILPGDYSSFKRLTGEYNIWKHFDQVVCPIDSVKPMDGRKGWNKEQTLRYNRERFEDLISAGWDLVIIDEAHRLGGSTDQVARFRLGQSLAEAAPYLLLLSATPHQGKSDAFYRLISMLDSEAFPDIESVTRDRVKPFVIRTEKRQTINYDGQPLFKPRKTQIVPVSWVGHFQQEQLYQAVTEYVRIGYNQALAQKRNYIGFLMILMQRLVVSSTLAIRTTLQRRLETFDEPEEQMSLFPAGLEEEWSDLDGQEQYEAILHARISAFKNEKTEVRNLLKIADQCEASGSDAKAETLIEWIYRLQQEENNADLKILIFTEFVPTQEMLKKFLDDRGFSVVCLNGSMDLDERKKAQEQFGDKTRIMLSTDAGGEGLNLQFCHVVINYDIPWNPMRIEQRIGRVDRIGQEHVVRALNFVLENSVEHRVREVLDQKLAVILNEFGVDKTGDVIDSALAGKLFDELYTDAIIHPDNIEKAVDRVVTQVQTIATDERQKSVLADSETSFDMTIAQQLHDHPLPHWVERMTTSYIRSFGGAAEIKNKAWRLVWPDGEIHNATVFSGKDAQHRPSATHLTIENKRVRSLAVSIPFWVQEQQIPQVNIRGLSADITGFWSIWKIGGFTETWRANRFIPLFLHTDGRFLGPTARRIWEIFLTDDILIEGSLSLDESVSVFPTMLELAEKEGLTFYRELMSRHNEFVKQKKENGEYSFSAMRRAAERIGLPEVKNFRLAQIQKEEHAWKQEMDTMNVVTPELTCHIIVKCKGDK